MSLYPKVKHSIGGETHKRPSEVNQQIPQAVRPMLPRDGTPNGQNQIGGKMPAGYISIWDFGNGTQTKLSPTSVRERKIY